MMMNRLDLPNLGNDVAPYETEMLDFLRGKSPPDRVSITIHEAREGGSRYRYHDAWQAGTKSVTEVAKLVAQIVVRGYNEHASRTLEGITIKF